MKKNILSLLIFTLAHSVQGQVETEQQLMSLQKEIQYRIADRDSLIKATIPQISRKLKSDSIAAQIIDYKQLIDVLVSRLQLSEQTANNHLSAIKELEEKKEMLEFLTSEDTCIFLKPAPQLDYIPQALGLHVKAIMKIIELREKTDIVDAKIASVKKKLEGLKANVNSVIHDEIAQDVSELERILGEIASMDRSSLSPLQKKYLSSLNQKYNNYLNFE